MDRIARGGGVADAIGNFKGRTYGQKCRPLGQLLEAWPERSPCPASLCMASQCAPFCDPQDAKSNGLLIQTDDMSRFNAFIASKNNTGGATNHGLGWETLRFLHE